MRKSLSKKHREQLERLSEMPDSEIDFADIPETSTLRPVKLPIAMRIDSDVLGWLRLQPDYETKVNLILRDAMSAARRAAAAKRAELARKRRR